MLIRSLRRGAAVLVVALAVTLPVSRAAAQVRMPTHVACVGDSITYGYMASSASASYPSVLQNLFGSSVQVKNYGHNSATMLSTGDLPYQTLSEYTAATTFVSGAGSAAVVDVIIMLGTNDSKSYNWMAGSSTRAQQFVTDCGAMVDHFASLSTHPQVYLAFPPRAFANSYGISGTIIHDQILPLIQQVATAKGVPIIDVDTPTASRSNLFPDGVHPNDTGYALVAKVMHDGLLAPLGAGGRRRGRTRRRFGPSRARRARWKVKVAKVAKVAKVEGAERPGAPALPEPAAMAANQVARAARRPAADKLVASAARTARAAPRRPAAGAVPAKVAKLAKGDRPPAPEPLEPAAAGTVKAETAAAAVRTPLVEQAMGAEVPPASTQETATPAGAAAPVPWPAAASPAPPVCCSPRSLPLLS